MTDPRPGAPGTHDAAPVATATAARQGTRNPTVAIILGVSLLLCLLAAVFLYGFAPDGPSPAERKGDIELMPATRFATASSARA